MKITKLTNNTSETTVLINQKFIIQWLGESSVEKYSWHSYLGISSIPNSGYMLIFIDCFMAKIKYIICCNEIYSTDINLPPESIGKVEIKDNNLKISHASDYNLEPRIQIKAENFEVFEVDCINNEWLNLNPIQLHN
jgi:hypothetical protein